MTDQQIGTREEWQAARSDLAKLEAEYAELGQRVTEQRRRLPWVPVEKEYVFDTQEGKKTLAELFDGRSQLLAYNVMFGPDYALGACPGCTSLADELDGTLVHLQPPRCHPRVLLARTRSIGSAPTSSAWAGSSRTCRRTSPISRSTSGWP